MRYMMTLPLIALGALGGCDTVRGAAQDVAGIFKPSDGSATPAADPGAPLAAPEGLSETGLPPGPAPAPLGPDALTGSGAATVAGLGDPSRTGLWLETPLVGTQQPGQVIRKSSGAQLRVTLIPVEGEASAGSRLSLQAMRALGVPLTELVELTVYPAS